MIINNLFIKNFRGIKECDIDFSLQSRIVCLIGAGDSTKSTILKAIEWILWPSWNLVVSDSDFYQCDTSTSIIIRGTFSEIPDQLIAEDKYGLHLRRPSIPIAEGINDEPKDGEQLCLTIQLTINESLEPRWEVVCNRNEPKSLSLADRKMLLSNSIGTNCSKDLAWGKFSILQKYADSKGTLRDVQLIALRNIAQNADLSELDNISEIIQSIGKTYGVGFDGEITNHLQIQGGSLSTTVGLFDGNAPLSQRGLGSQRLLSMGLNINASSNGSILLLDEIESGLEPYRLRNLINELRQSALKSKSGQVIMTTHSPVAVAECTIAEILVIQSTDGVTKAYKLKGSNEKANNSLQAQIRRNSEAFLSKRIIICEGKTEIGFIRALDTYLANEKQRRLAFTGVSTADGGGSAIFDCANKLMECGYKICLIMDSDVPEEERQKDMLKEKGVRIFDWDAQNSIEEQIFHDIPNDVANDLIDLAIKEYGIDSIKSRLSSIPHSEQNNHITVDIADNEIRKSIGSIAKKQGAEWFKRIDHGEALGNVIFENLSKLDENCKLKQVINEIIDWITQND